MAHPPRYRRWSAPQPSKALLPAPERSQASACHLSRMCPWYTSSKGSLPEGPGSYCSRAPYLVVLQPLFRPGVTTTFVLRSTPATRPRRHLADACQAGGTTADRPRRTTWRSPTGTHCGSDRPGSSRVIHRSPAARTPVVAFVPADLFAVASAGDGLVNFFEASISPQTRLRSR